MTRGLDPHHAPRDEGDGDPAPLVDPAARAIDVGEADRHPIDATREPPQGEVQATSDVVPQLVPQFVLPGVDVQLHVFTLESDGRADC